MGLEVAPDYTLDRPWTSSVSGGFTVYGAATITLVEFQNNVLVGNAGRATANIGVQVSPALIWTARSSQGLNHIVQNNYFDPCGVYHATKTGSPHYTCVVQNATA
jgi:hypothetical protein